MLLQVAMNVEAQAINVPTRARDYRPALYGDLAPVELRVDAVQRVAPDVDLSEILSRIVLAYTGKPRNSGTNSWEIPEPHLDSDRQVFDCFERIRDTAVTMRHGPVRQDWDEVGRQIDREWENRERLAPRLHHAGHRGPDRPSQGRRVHVVSGPSCAIARPGRLRTVATAIAAATTRP